MTLACFGSLKIHVPARRVYRGFLVAMLGTTNQLTVHIEYYIQTFQNHFVCANKKIQKDYTKQKSSKCYKTVCFSVVNFLCFSMSETFSVSAAPRCVGLVLDGLVAKSPPLSAQVDGPGNLGMRPRFPAGLRLFRANHKKISTNQLATDFFFTWHL